MLKAHQRTFGYLTVMILTFGALCFFAWALCTTVALGQEPKTWNVTLAWDANTEADLAGYRLYVANSPGGQTLGAGNELVQVGGETEVTVPMVAGDHYFVLTAYDTSGNESGPSNEAFLHLDEVPPENPNLKIKLIIQVEIITP